MKIMKKIIAVASCCAILGCDLSTVKDPPITITFRQGMLSKHVMQVNNLSAAEGIEVYVYIANATNSMRSGNVVVPANGFKEFGALELDWEFKAGDRGFICPVKYGKKLFFELSQNEQYRTWFGIDDIPEVDVAAQVRARREAERKAKVEAAVKATVNAGRELFVAITQANTEREASGLAHLWPRSDEVFPEIAVEKGVMEKLKGWKNKVISRFGGNKNGTTTKDVEDIAEAKFKTSSEYFDCLFHIRMLGTKEYDPYVNVGIDVISSARPQNGTLSAESIRWSVLADYEFEVSDGIPILVSSNFPCEKFRSFWDGREHANDVIKLLPVGELGDEACVFIYANGKGKALPASRVTLANIYDGPFNTLKTGYNKPLRYLTPHGVKTVQAAMSNIEETRIEVARSLIKNIEDACQMYSMKHGKYPNRLAELKRGDGGTPPFIGGGFEDPWGNEIKYEKKGKRIYLTSFGPDGKEGTEDDLTNIRNR